MSFSKLAAVVLAGAALGIAVIPQRAATQSPSAEPVPAYHSQLPASPLPETLSPSLFRDTVVRNAYAVAARMKKVLYQQPCYCYCDRSLGHGSLLDCFASKHGSGCDVCMREAFYAYEQTRRGRTPAQIREGIKKGEWQSLDVSKYQKPLPAR